MLPNGLSVDEALNRYRNDPNVLYAEPDYRVHATAIPDGDPSPELHNRSNIAGISKWSVDGEKCFGYWSKINSDCSVCIRVCPYTRDYSLARNRWWARLAGTRFRGLALRVHDRFGGGKRLSASDWWPSDDGTPVELGTKPGGADANGAAPPD